MTHATARSIVLLLLLAVGLAGLPANARASHQSDASRIYAPVAAHDRALKPREGEIAARVHRRANEIEICLQRVNDDVALHPGDYAPSNPNRQNHAEDVANTMEYVDLAQVRMQSTRQEVARVQRVWRGMHPSSEATRRVLTALARQTDVLRDSRPIATCALYRAWARVGLDPGRAPRHRLLNLTAQDRRDRRAIARFARAVLSRAKADRLSRWPHR